MTEYKDRFDYAQIPDHMMQSMKQYIEKGRPMGGFLTAVFAGDLFKAVSNADDTNFKIIPIYVYWIKNFAPIGCIGSYERVEKWAREKRDELKELS